MSKIVKVQIRNFRKLKRFDAVFGTRNVICLIGRGDSGKSSVLDAISYCLSPSWNISVSDYDFHKCNVLEPIEIRIIVTDLPEDFLLMNKYGMYCSGWDAVNQKVVDATEDGCIPALQIVLTIDASLEPKWEVINCTSNESLPISARDRSRLQVYTVSDYVNNHFAWANGSPLNSLSHAIGESLDAESLLGVVRKIRAASKDVQFGDFSELLDLIEHQADTLGLCPGKLAPAFDMKRLMVKEGTVCLHDRHDLPLRLMGKGAKRLMSIAIQSAVSSGKGVILIDEIEQGLEPDRVCNLVRSFILQNKGQIFFTTHSSEALTEMDAENVFWLKNPERPIALSKDVQDIVRSNPWAFFGKRVILCEGKTECGFCRALDEFFVSEGEKSMSAMGVTVVNGEGSKFAVYARELLSLDVPFILFCDSDEKTANIRKEALAKTGVCVVEWGNQDSFEQGIYKELPDSGVLALNKAACELKQMSIEAAESSILALINHEDSSVTRPMLFTDGESFSSALRQLLGKTAKGKCDKGGAWFKSITGGKRVGEIVCNCYECLPTSGYIKNNIDAIRKWLFYV